MASASGVVAMESVGWAHELRRHPRLTYDRRGWCEHRDLTLYLPLANVSRGGMFLQTSAAFDLGETMRVSLDVPGTPVGRVVADVEVVWAGRSGRVTGIGCRVLVFYEGENTYFSLLERLSTSA